METTEGLTALLASRTRRMHVSVIREILKAVSDGGIVSLAGGIPAPETLPKELVPELVARVLERYGPAPLQYDRTEGFPPFVAALVPYLAAKGVQASPGNTLVASGSQGVLDLLGKVLIDEGDRIAVEAPTYLGALQAFNPYGPRYVQLETDADGLIPESLEQVLSNTRVKFVYTVPTFQNPTGRTIPWERRVHIAEILRRHDTLLIEDDPYSALRYVGEDVPPIHSLAPDHVVYVGTLSKVLAPGLRIGFCVAPPPIFKWLVVAKQGADLHTSTFNQAIAAEYISGGYLAEHLPKIVSVYAPRRQAMLDALKAHMPAAMKWSRAEGGMFVWVEGPKGLDTDAVYQEALRRGVAFVPGRVFYTEPDSGRETMRLNFTMSDEATIERAVGVIGSVLKEHA